MSLGCLKGFLFHIDVCSYHSFFSSPKHNLIHAVVYFSYCFLSLAGCWQRVSVHPSHPATHTPPLPAGLPTPQKQPAVQRGRSVQLSQTVSRRRGATDWVHLIHLTAAWLLGKKKQNTRRQGRVIEKGTAQQFWESVFCQIRRWISVSLSPSQFLSASSLCAKLGKTCSSLDLLLNWMFFQLEEILFYCFVFSDHPVRKEL